MTLSLLREIVHATAQRAPQGFASAAALRMAAHQAAPSPQDQQQLSEILKKHRTAMSKEEQELKAQLQQYEGSIKALQQAVLTSHTAGNEQREAMLALLRSFSGQQEQATKRLSRLVVAQITALSDKADAHHTTGIQRINQLEEGQNAAFAALQQVNEAQRAELKTLTSMLQSLQASMQPLLFRAAASQRTSQHPAGQAARLRAAGNDHKRGLTKQQDGFRNIYKGTQYEQAGAYAQALEAYEDALADCERAVTFFEKALRRARKLNSPTVATWEADLKDIQAVLEKLRAYVGKQKKALGIVEPAYLSARKILLLGAATPNKDPQ